MEKTKTQLIDILTKMVDKQGSIPINNTSIEDVGGTYQLVDLVRDDDEVGVTTRSWFWPLSELTKKELQAIYSDVRKNVA